MDSECSTDYCNIQKCLCETQPPVIRMLRIVTGDSCKIIAVLRAVAAALATLIIVYNGLRWSAAGGDLAIRKDAQDWIKHTFVGLIIIVVALELINGLFAEYLGAVIC
jgi:type IV secretory pathway VirB2 component (pilin)